MVKESVKVKARISSKGQVTIPKAIRERLGVRPGDDVEFVLEPGGVRVRRDSAAFLEALVLEGDGGRRRR